MENEATTGEKMTTELEKIAKAVDGINTNGFGRKMLIIYVKDKTGLGKQKIELVLEAIDEFSKEMSKNDQK